MKTMTFLAGMAVGYVLGSRAGQERYQEIVEGVRRLGNQPVVQQAQSKVSSLVDQGTDKATGKLADVTDKVTDKLAGTGATPEPGVTT